MADDVEAILAAGSIEAIGRAFRTGGLSIHGAVTWYLARIAETNAIRPPLNAVRVVSPHALKDAAVADAELAAGHDRGPLHGIPVLLKDSILTADGMTATGGAAAFADFVPHVDATLVSRLRRAGAIVLGKTNMTELADYVSDVMPSEFSSAGGVVRNPHGAIYGRGQGSSVGSAAAVAAQLAPFAIGSETQNSIQAPAAHSSVFGFKPTVGHVSRYGIIPLVPSQDSPGPITRSAADAAIVMKVLAGPDPRDTATLERVNPATSFAHLDSVAGLRIGVLRRYQADRPEFGGVATEFERVLSRLSACGAVIIDPCDLPAAEQIHEVRSSVFRTEFKMALNAFLVDHGAPCGIASLAELIRWNEQNPKQIPYGQPLLLAANETEVGQAYLPDRCRDIALSGPGGIEGALGSASADVLIAPMASAAKCSGKAGTPVAAIPIGRNGDGVPVGITLHARRGEDAKLLAIAQAIEQTVGERVTPQM
jgi:amidase